MVHCVTTDLPRRLYDLATTCSHWVTTDDARVLMAAKEVVDRIDDEMRAMDDHWASLEAGGRVVSDICERLRRIGDAGSTESRVALEAAREIEKLRALVDEYQAAGEAMVQSVATALGYDQ